MFPVGFAKVHRHFSEQYLTTNLHISVRFTDKVVNVVRKVYRVCPKKYNLVIEFMLVVETSVWVVLRRVSTPLVPCTLCKKQRGAVVATLVPFGSVASPQRGKKLNTFRWSWEMKFERVEKNFIE